MMDDIRTYLLQIIATAILCGIVSSLCETSKFAALIRVILGIVVTVCVLRPLLNINTDFIPQNLLEISYSGSEIIEQGNDTAQAALFDIISEKTGQCIQSKARQLGSDVTVVVDLVDGVPSSATISGDIPPYVRSQLSAWITSEIGIEREAQNWS